jgi:hypothetical protein
MEKPSFKEVSLISWCIMVDFPVPEGAESMMIFPFIDDVAI